MDLITKKELESITRGNFGANEYGSAAGSGPRPGGGNTHEIMVPKQAVGVVIGKGGDMIKKIQQDSGAHVQFLNVKDESPEDKVCVVTGSPEQIQAASTFIKDLIQSFNQFNISESSGSLRMDQERPSSSQTHENKSKQKYSKAGFIEDTGNDESVTSDNSTLVSRKEMQTRDFVSFTKTEDESAECNAGYDDATIHKHKKQKLFENYHQAFFGLMDSMILWLTEENQIKVKKEIKDKMLNFQLCKLNKQSENEMERNYALLALEEEIIASFFKFRSSELQDRESK